MNIDISGFGPSVTTLLQVRSHELFPHIDRLRHVLESGGYSVPEASVNVPFDDILLTQVDELVLKIITKQLRYVFLVGIGGSNLGAEAVYQALYKGRDVAPHDAPRLIGLDTNSGTWLGGVMKLVATIKDTNEFVVVGVSKSGNTTETIANIEILLEVLEKQCKRPMPERVVVIGDENSPFLHAAQKQGMYTFAIPHLVGGRYSIFTAVGLIPLALCGIDIHELNKGGRDALSRVTHQDIMFNPLAQIALLSVEAHRSNHIIHNFFVFNNELETIGKWWRQLVGESCGKVSIQKHEPVGIVPTVSIGSTDLHSVGQLYLGGPSQTFTIFTHCDDKASLRVPEQRVFPDLVPMVTGKSTGEIMQAILMGTQAAYRDKERPFITLHIPDINPYQLGFLLQSLMVVTIFTANLLDVDPFNQPDVEAYKIKTKEILDNHY